MGKMKFLPVFFDVRKSLSVMTDEQFGRVIRAAADYMDEGIEPTLEPIEAIGFQMIKDSALRSASKYEERCQKNRENVNKRWASQTDTNVYDGIPSNTNAYEPIRTDTKDTKKKEERRKKKENASSYEDAGEAAARKAPPEDDSPVVAAMLLNDGSEYPLTERMAEEYGRLYPAVDIRQQFRNMAGWAKGNPGKRKTKSGVGRFINSWLAREQNSYHGEPRAAPAYRPPAQDNGMMDFLNSVIAGDDTYDKTGDGGNPQDTQDSVSGILFQAPGG